VTPDIFVPGAFFATVVALGLGVPFVRAYTRRMDRSAVASGVSADLAARLDRIEAMIESVAVEVERLSEGQRFTTRLLSEGSALPGLVRAREAAPVNPLETTHA